MTIYPYNIEVIIYAYKSKVVIDKIKNLLKTLSGENKILIRLLDQYQIDRSKHIDQLSEKYNKNCKIIYNHIKDEYVDYIDTRDELISLLPKNLICAELGVFKGDFSKVIFQKMQPYAMKT